MERAALDRAIIATYTAAGITNDPATWHPPRAAAARPGRRTRRRRQRRGHATWPPGSTPWVDGSFRDLFDGPTTTHPAGHLVVWSTRQLPDELRAPGMLLALDAIWRDVDLPPRHRAGGPPARLVVVDEAWTLLKDGEGAKFLYRLSKAARKRCAGVAVITQDAADLLGSDLGQAVVANAATQILMRQAPQAIDQIADTFAPHRRRSTPAPGRQPGRSAPAQRHLPGRASRRCPRRKSTRCASATRRPDDVDPDRRAASRPLSGRPPATRLRRPLRPE